MFKLAVICGGSSAERGISLNSSRSLMDHVANDQIQIFPLFVDWQLKFYLISPAQLYSNTPADFDFKLNQTAKSLSQDELQAFLKSVDLVFPTIHGPFGEDGTLQAILEEWNIPYVGSTSTSCRLMFSKYKAAQALSKAGFNTLPSALLKAGEKEENKKTIEEFFNLHQLKRAIVKPVIGGSSIGVYSVSTAEEAFKKSENLFSRKIGHEAILEPFCEGREFTIVVFQNEQGEPVSLIPTEIETGYENNQIFDYRKKYLPTENTSYHTPPRFSDEIIQAIRKQASEIFELFQMRDFVRLDGWLVNQQDLYFTDINPLSGLEQNSFLFRQASILGQTHKEALNYIIKRACDRYQIKFPDLKSSRNKDCLPVYVVFGGKNSERQVSLMSGANVWLKLLQSNRYEPRPCFYDRSGMVWELPYSYVLNHTVEEVRYDCLATQQIKSRLLTFAPQIQKQLGIFTPFGQLAQALILPQFLQKVQTEKAFVFIAMHGGEGEDGTLQRCLEGYGIPYNGSNSKTSHLCMDKYRTGQVINEMNDPDILSLIKMNMTSALIQDYNHADYERLWGQMTHEMQATHFIIKPRSDGCSAGIVLLQSCEDLERYCGFILREANAIPPYSFANQETLIEMPSSLGTEFLVEPYIETDSILIQQNELLHTPKQGWIELTVGVLEQKGVYHSFNPSITLAEGAVLSLEEKFQGGTGVNITPPCDSILALEDTQKIRKGIEKIARALGIENYARIDIFFNRLTKKIIVIEANTLPGLTPSTVIYHQALAEKPPLTPTAFLEKLITSKLESLPQLSVKFKSIN